MSYSLKIQSASGIVDSHNQNVEEKQKINFEDFISKLKQMGGTTEETLSQCSWEDLESCGLPRLLARQISKVFREKEEKSEYLSDRKVRFMTVKELLERYSPKDSESPINKRLIEISKGQRCIIFNDDKSININESAIMIEDIKNGLPDLSIKIIDSRPKQVYKVNEKEDSFADENPIYPSRVLRSGEVCDQTGRSWSGVSLTIRQLLYIAVSETKELKISSLDDAHNALDKSLTEEAEKMIRNRYPKASLMFDELQKNGQLPILKVSLSNCSDSIKNDPFYTNKTF